MKTSLSAVAFALSMASAPVFADFAVNIGAIGVYPDDSSSSLSVIEQVAGLPAGSTQVAVDSNLQLGITLDYMINKNWTVELIAATPFSHDISVKGSAIHGLDIGKTKHLPPTLLLQYHFNTGSDAVSPFVGLGVNYTRFFDEEVSGELKDTLGALGVVGAGDKADLSLSDSWGLALQAGVNVQFTERLGLHAMVSKMDIDTTGRVKVNGNTVQSVEVDIDPLVAMIGLRIKL